MVSIHSKWRYFFMFLGIQLVVMALLSREGYQKRVSYFIRIFRKPDPNGVSSRNHTTASIPGGDVYANLSRLSKTHSYGNDMPYCPKTSPLIGGPIHVSFPSGLTLEEVQRKNPLVVRGGRYRPPDCEARHRTAIIIPHRQREHHLKFLLYYLHPFLQRQQLHYGIYVIHQAGNYTFNRAKLMNVGFREAMREEDWDCLFFHDVDLIPEDDRNTYICDSNPKHAAIAMDKFGYKLPYKMYFGGVSALTPLHYLKMNGFPNNYWGWGGEDDDIGVRVSLAGMYITRPSLKVGRYKMIKHKLDKGNDVNPQRFNMLAKTRTTWKLDGMNTAEYETISRQYLPLYTNITVNIGTEAGLHPPPPPTHPQAAKAESKPEVKAPAGADGKPEVKISAKADGKPEVKISAKADGKPEVKISAKADGKPEVKISAKADGKPEDKADSKPEVQVATEVILKGPGKLKEGPSEK